ncbi:RNA-directed DNA polymerase, eukaryota, Reverse transcriptase zinc-binding domain protein [Artemisia annua]|uniref:RNA-directed DNA polymerase, eukaryota, Reverse transcriptase zinc-binding domain protein n=1 Tax=Artemisia annua TaxID=35608 RepID=A0A2U1L785_ARTAN|nr:RNA-directed DNA polymerase, eukaryota, Reverse transcriptase zinc-binding domain protein [Artemisia annua]
MVWLAIHGRLKTHDIMGSWERRNDMMCVFCNSRPDSHNHLFFECDFPCKIWNEVKCLVGMDFAPNSWSDIQHYMLNRPINRSRSFNEVHNLIKDTVRLRVMSLSLKASPRVFEAANIWGFQVMQSHGGKRWRYKEGAFDVCCMVVRILWFYELAEVSSLTDYLTLCVPSTDNDGTILLSLWPLKFGYRSSGLVIEFGVYLLLSGLGIYDLVDWGGVYKLDCNGLIVLWACESSMLCKGNIVYLIHAFQWIEVLKAKVILVGVLYESCTLFSLPGACPDGVY